jgi:hypothetical protein
MATPQLFDAMQVQAWRKNMQKQLIQRSVWEQMSNRVNETVQIPNKKGFDEVPDAVLVNVSDDFDAGTRSTTVPFLGKLNQKGQFGRQQALNNEETPSMKYKAIRYNVERKSIALEEESVDGDLNRFYRIGAQGTNLLTDYFTELTDFNAHRALFEGANWALTETEAWSGPSITTPPVARSYNPNTYANGKSAVATYNTAVATHEANIQAYYDTLTAGANPFDLQALDAMVLLASQIVIPLKWSASGQSINWVFLLSEFQLQQLQDTTTSNSWAQLMREADVRGDMNRAISGVVGVYRNALVISNPRSPLWNSAGAANAYMAYVKPWSGGAFYNSADAAVARATKSGAGVGTLELASVLGRSALGAAKIKDERFDEEKRDYNFFKGVCGMRACGMERMDFNIATPTNTSILNQTAFTYATASPATVY